MRIKGLTVYGFKSFPEELKLKFHPGINTIVGPNGSGKTNIFDAIRWIFGEQSPSNLRCEKVEDLIFLGSQKRRSPGFTEVRLHLENSGELHEYGPEIEIMRRFYRSHESDFYINRSPCRLKDIHNLALKIGGLSYAFLELSKIEDIIKGDIRRMFEESAGIAQYYEKRDQALRRIARGEAELARLEDIINEMARNVRSLKRQARKVERLKKLKKLRKQAELRHIITHLDKIEPELKKSKEKLKSLELEEQNKTDKSKKLRSELNDLDQLISRYDEKLAKKKALDWETKRLTDEKGKRREGIPQVEQELADYEQTITKNTEKIEGYQKELNSKEKLLKEVVEQLIKQENRFSELIEHRQSFTSDQSEMLAELKSSQILTSRLRNEIGNLEGELLKVKNDLQQLNVNYEQQKDQNNKLEKKENDLSTQHQKLTQIFRNISKEQESLVDEEMELNAEIQGLEKMVKTRKEKYYKNKFKDKFVGMVYNLVKPKSGYERAIDALLGEISGYAVVTSLDYHLLTDPNKQSIGIILADKNDIKKKVKSKFVEYPAALSHFFEGVKFVSELPDKTDGKIVTKQGLLISPDLIRSSSFGHLEISSRLQQLKNRKGEIKEQIESYRYEIKKMNKEINDLADNLNTIRSDLEDIKSKLHNEGNLIDLKKTQIKSTQERIDNLQREKVSLDRRLGKVQGIVNKRSTDMEHFNREIQERKTKISTLKQKENNLRSEIERIKLELAHDKIEIENLKMNVGTYSKQLINDKKRIDDIEIKLIEIEAEKKELGELPEEAWSKRKEIIDLSDSLERKIQKIKETIYQVRLEHYKLEEEKNRLTQEFKNYDIELTADESIPDIETIEAKIASIGTVNPLSINQHAAEKERLDNFIEQRNDVASAIEKLKNSIKKSDQNATHRLVEKLQAVNLEFGLVFETIFGGGSGKVRFQDPNNPLQSPIEIVAALKGKRIKRLSQLSGGERSLLAITLLFAFYRVNPAPFLILDEVDAPLDDTNVRRLSGFLKELAKDIQIIIITHNPVTVKIADYLYGVTMEEPGVSKVVAVDFRDVARIME